MKLYSFRNSLTALFLLFAFITVSCGDKGNEAGNSSMISGTDSKTWKADRETTATGEKDKLTKEEKKESITFYANSKFTMTSPANTMNGTWTYDAGMKNLSLQFEGNNVTENFKVENLSEKDMKLVAGDGSTMTLEAE